MRLLNSEASAVPNTAKLSLSLATSEAEVREVQRLRYKIFIEAMGLSLPGHENGRDEDEYDALCEHLIVRDTRNLKVAGTYRVLSPSAARRAGGYYAEREFDLERLAPIRDRMAEAGRACVHPDYRSGGVIALLWAGLAALMAREKCEYLIGCASTSLADGGHNAAAIYHSVASKHLAPPEYQVTPLLPFPLDGRDIVVTPQVPPLIKGYLRGGAWVGGAPAWDPDFHTADLFMLLPLPRLEARYARHYFKQSGMQ